MSSQPITLYLNFLSQKGYSSSSINSIQKVLRHIPHPLNKETLWNYQQKLSHLKTNTRISYLSKLKGFLRYLGQDELLNEIIIPKSGLSLPQDIPDVHTLSRIIESPNPHSFKGIRDRAILETLYSSGLRKSELANLKFQDLDLQNQLLTVRAGKGNKDRIVPIGTLACLAIDRYIRKVRNKVLKNEQLHLFLSNNGNPISSHMMYNIIKPYSLNPHRYRHSYATHLLQNGMKLTSLSRLLGHSSLKSTQLYTKITIQDLKTAYNKFHKRDKWKC